MRELVFTEDNRVKGFDLILRRESEVCDIEKHHGYLLSNIFVKNNDYTRSTMKVAFDKAVVPVIEPDRPIIVSTYNRDLNFFNPYKVSKPKGTRVIKKIHRNIAEGDPRFCVIYKIANKIFFMEHKRFITFGEGTSIYNETFEGDFIKKTTSFTNDGMLCLGQNALVLYTNELDIIEDSSLVSVISITDLTKVGKEIVANTFSPFETWIVIALVYLSITSVLSFIGHRLEKRMAAKGGMS